jgi:tRNA pseudouridine13 synthase
MDTQRIYLQNHNPINFKFSQNKDDFIVEEIPVREFNKKGNFVVLKIEKQNTSTWELIQRIAEILEIDEHQIGYAGLKDKSATTIQYISVPLRYSKDYRKINNRSIKVLDTYLHNQKLKIGDLKGNRFKITLICRN